MKHKARVGLAAIFAAILILAIAISAFANSANSGECQILWRAYDVFGGVWTVSIPGEQVSTWSGNILTTTCSGTIPLGVSFGTNTYFDLDYARTWLCEEYEVCDIGTPFSIDNEDFPATSRIDYKGQEYIAESWSYLIKNNGYCVVESVFIID